MDSHIASSMVDLYVQDRYSRLLGKQPVVINHREAGTILGDSACSFGCILKRLEEVDRQGRLE